MLAFLSVETFHTVYNSNMTIAQAVAQELVYQVPRSETYSVNINGKNIAIWDVPLPF